MISQDSYDSLQMKIRSLESKEAKALSAGDLTSLYNLWDDDFVFSQNNRSLPLIELRGILTNQKFPNTPINREFLVYIADNNVAVAVGSNGTGESFSDVWIKRNSG